MGIFAREFQDADVKVLLLSDIRKVFDTSKVNSSAKQDMLAALHGLDADWNEFHGIRGAQQPHKLKETELASMLREFKIRLGSIWPLNRTAKSRSAKGYRRSQFEEAWRAYCTDDGTPAHHNNIGTLRLASDGTV